MELVAYKLFSVTSRDHDLSHDLVSGQSRSVDAQSGRRKDPTADRAASFWRLYSEVLSGFAKRAGLALNEGSEHMLILSLAHKEQADLHATRKLFHREQNAMSEFSVDR